MASQTDIVNIALTMLGESRVLSIDDDIKPAREARAIYTSVLDSLLGGYNWSFAKKRAQLSASVTAPVHQYARAFPIPNEALRMLFIGEYYVGADLVDFRGADTSIYTIEGREILTDLAAPLNVRYIWKIRDTTKFHANFVTTFAARMAYYLAEPLTQSNTKKEQAKEAFKMELREAVRANAIELPPERLADDDWILSRQ